MAKIRLEKVNKDNKVEIILINSNFINLKKELEEVDIDYIT
ncbi:MAG: hypothetical protein P1U46_00355 [Patescibacteria group bacterium]|nr:hypothetical protein [Patescibacteria group bacterium]